jgi:hypothetical protein
MRPHPHSHMWRVGGDASARHAMVFASSSAIQAAATE